jgi:hypothetical protein
MANQRSVPAQDLETKSFEFQGETYDVKKKFKMMKFFRLINQNPVDALSLALTEESLERLEELDLDMDDFKVLIENLSQALAGTTSGN